MNDFFKVVIKQLIKIGLLVMGGSIIGRCLSQPNSFVSEVLFCFGATVIVMGFKL